MPISSELELWKEREDKNYRLYLLVVGSWRRWVAALIIFFFGMALGISVDPTATVGFLAEDPIAPHLLQLSTILLILSASPLLMLILFYMFLVTEGPMPPPRVAVLSGFGINCETETMAVFEMAGASADRIHVNRLVSGEATLSDYDIMAVPGGFSFGDHLGSGRLMGNRLRFGLREQVREFVAEGKPVIGICNGFQVLVKMGLLPGDDEVSLTQTASLALNDSGQYENRWATLEFDPNSPCIWTKGITRMRVPVRHGEGKFVTDDPGLLDEWAESGQLVARYVEPGSEYPSSRDEVLPYPISPNQSWRNIAGVCDPSGLVFGLMPHPEANHSTWLGATWTREETKHGEGEGMAIFHNAVEYAARSVISDSR